MDRDHLDQLQEDLVEARKKRRKRSDSPKTPSGSPPPPLPPHPPSLGASGALDSTKPHVTTYQSSAWTISDTRDKPSGSSVHHLSPLDDQQLNEDSVPVDEEHSSGDDDLGTVLKVPSRKDWWKPHDDDERLATPEPAWVIPTSHIPDAVNNWANALASTYQAPIENSLLEKTRYMRTFMNWYCQTVGKIDLTQADFEGQAYEANPEGDQVRIDISRPLPLSGPPGHVTIQTQFFFNKYLDYLRYGSKGSGQALSISKMKAARYPDFGLELIVPDHIWGNDVCTYDMSASYVRTHMRILSVVRIKAYSRCGYDYLKEITLRITDYKEYMITEKDFKNLYPSDFEDLNLLLLQGHLNHLPRSDKRWDAKGFEYKHDYTIIESPRVVVFPVCNNEQKIMRFNEIYKFSDGTLTNILEALD
ncbi:hypothetical protein Tco_0458538 [Tanacetum coccineum]